jgi:hypothetical protein
LRKPSPRKRSRSRTRGGQQPPQTNPPPASE